jgi:hypothetical protein
MEMWTSKYVLMQYWLCKYELAISSIIALYTLSLILSYLKVHNSIWNLSTALRLLNICILLYGLKGCGIA